ncbi:MAG TPA: hypothetical protein VF712_04920, partial [Thermoleophilaceae bacterium]
VVHALEHAALNDLPGIYNVGADGVLALSEVAGLLGKPYAPILPPWGTGTAANLLRRFGLRVPPEMLNQLRFGRGVDNRRFKAGGFRYGYTSRETVLKLGEHLRLDPIVRGATEPYRYEREVEDFLRWSPHVRNPAFRTENRLTPVELLELRRLHAGYAARTGQPGTDSPSQQAQTMAHAARSIEPDDGPAETANGGPQEAPEPEPAHGAAPIEHYDDLEPDEIMSLLDSLETGDLVALRDHERGRQGRPRVLAAIDGVLVRRETPQSG